VAWEPTIAEFEEFLGGAHVLRQLTDPNRTGQPNYGTAQTYLDAGCAEVRERIEVKHTPETVANLDAVSAQRTHDAALAMAARIAYERGAQGQAMPQKLADAATRADTWLDELVEGKRRLGRAAGGRAAALDQPAKVVDPDPQGTGISRAAFARGFT
jgi:hypothetical protein